MNRWNINHHGLGVNLDVLSTPLPYEDDLEMSGFGASYVVFYSINPDRTYQLTRHCVFPGFRTRPNITHSSLKYVINEEFVPVIKSNNTPITEYLNKVIIDGVLSFVSETRDGLRVIRKCFPSRSHESVSEIIEITNLSDNPAVLECSSPNFSNVATGNGGFGIYPIEIMHDFNGSVTLMKNEKYVFSFSVAVRYANQPIQFPIPEEELQKRRKHVFELTSNLTLDTGNNVIDMMFTMAKLRAGESIFRTRSGNIHCPGGLSYYGAVWANDQVEYSGPWFAYTGDSTLLDAAMNAYRWYMPFMDDNYTPFPSSIIAEGFDYWNGAGDRGDAAMYLYGATKFALICGNRSYAEELWEAIKWCAEYCNRQKNADGVIASDSDELENRLPSGDANLSTSALCYSGLIDAATLADALGETEFATEYRKRAQELEVAIENFFGYKIHDWDTYRYHDGNEILRSWIALPLCFGIETRKQGTIDALFSKYLWTQDGLRSAEGDDIIWDRSTLYAFRGVFASQETDRCFNEFYEYSETRLLGNRVPYACEAYPEGGKRHLSGESALYCKIITEGLLNIIPKGFNSFSFIPQLPKQLDHLYLKHISAFGNVFDIYIDRDRYSVITYNGTIVKEGKTGCGCVDVHFSTI